MKHPIYCCSYCTKLVTQDPEIPKSYLCTCFPVHGHYLPVEVHGELVGTVLVTSDIINQMQTHALAPQS